MRNTEASEMLHASAIQRHGLSSLYNCTTSSRVASLIGGRPRRTCRSLFDFASIIVVLSSFPVFLVARIHLFTYFCKYFLQVFCDICFSPYFPGFPLFHDTILTVVNFRARILTVILRAQLAGLILRVANRQKRVVAGFLSKMDALCPACAKCSAGQSASIFDMNRVTRHSWGVS